MKNFSLKGTIIKWILCMAHEMIRIYPKTTYFVYQLVTVTIISQLGRWTTYLAWWSLAHNDTFIIHTNCVLLQSILYGSTIFSFIDTAIVDFPPGATLLSLIYGYSLPIGLSELGPRGVTGNTYPNLAKLCINDFRYSIHIHT